ncbi:MAG TPA: exodeoxyribonuclease III [Candidatus Sulfomarinibacteraceae bacterium]|nr:exodeoxyribonuclease III [Candidatus Sulfomarinibacteraceae bacterium]
MTARDTIRLYSWNVNGLRACGRKGFLGWLDTERPDVLGLQETRALPDQLEPELREPDGYRTWFHPAERKGYSGVALLSGAEPRSVTLGGLGEERFDSEGRLIIADYGPFLFYTGYFPNGGHDLSRVPYKLEFSEAVLQHAEAQRKAGRSVVICGDVNTAHEEIDLANPASNRKNTGFLPEERAWVSRFLDHGYVDVFRRRNPDTPGLYTWWSNRPGVRERNVGWRIDYFFVSDDLVDHVIDARIHPEVLGSDHCPISLELEI